jgi:hypothetical protein
VAYAPFPTGRPTSGLGPADRFPGVAYSRTRVQIPLAPPVLGIDGGVLLLEDGDNLALAGDGGFLPVQFTPGLVTSTED